MQGTIWGPCWGRFNAPWGRHRASIPAGIRLRFLALISPFTCVRRQGVSLRSASPSPSSPPLSLLHPRRSLLLQTLLLQMRLRACSQATLPLPARQSHPGYMVKSPRSSYRDCIPRPERQSPVLRDLHLYQYGHQATPSSHFQMCFLFSSGFLFSLVFSRSGQDSSAQKVCWGVRECDDRSESPVTAARESQTHQPLHIKKNVIIV